MMRFTRNHGTNKAGDEVNSHPNEAYLLRVGVLEESQASEPLKAAELIELIKKAETADAVNDLIGKGEERKTVLAAAEKRLVELQAEKVQQTHTPKQEY